MVARYCDSCGNEIDSENFEEGIPTVNGKAYCMDCYNLEKEKSLKGRKVYFVK